jgi:hypothetical protein
MNRKARLTVALVVPLVLGGCARSPEDGRARGGGHGADGGNYGPNITDPPSKIDGTKDLSRFRGPSGDADR